MDIRDILLLGLSILTGYLLGCFLPGYFLPLWLKKIDIRQVGDGNPGFFNAAHQAGGLSALLTFLYDVPKGLLALLIVQYLFKLPVSYAYLAGVSALLGHKFPFYLGFKGGRGFAATIGLFVYIFVKILVSDFAPVPLLYFFIFIALYALLLLMAVHGKGDLFTITIFPLLGLYMLLHLPLSADLVFFLGLISVMTAEAARNLKRDGLTFAGEKGSAWRSLARPFALLFIPPGLFLTRSSLLSLSGSILGLFFLFDLLRLISSKVEAFSQRELRPGLRLCKAEEAGRFSAMTGFLAGLFLCFLFFGRSIACASLGFVSLGGLLAELVEANFGKRILFAQGRKTLEGSLAYMSVGVTVVFFFWSGGLLSLRSAGLGVLAATLIFSLSQRSSETVIGMLACAAIMSLS